YYNGAFALPPWGHLFREIVGDTTIDGVTYFRMWESRLTYHDGDPYIYERTDLVRHRASDSAFVSLRADAEYHFWESPFNLAAVRLEGPGWGIGSFCRPDSVSISDSVVGVAATKRFWSGGFEIAFAHGIGSTVFSGDGGPIATLVYARVGGGVFGTSIVGIDPAIPEPDKPLIVAVYPNPARDVVHIEPATLGFPTLLEVFDLTGRRVEQRHLPPFPSHQSIAVSRWPAGWYLLRLSGRGRAWSEILVIL
ncbi:MAG TPA: T9SS type A sorting domain-containing protein, partial [Rhodothermales bacterium]